MKNKGFTLIEFLIVMIIISILGKISIPTVTNYIEMAKKVTLITSANNVLSAYRNYIIANNITEDSNIELSKINALLDKKLISSPYKNNYKTSSKVYVSFENNKNPSFSICLIDNENLGLYKNIDDNIIPLKEEELLNKNIRDQVFTDKSYICPDK